MRPSLNERRIFYPGQNLGLTIDRIDAAGASQRSWTVRFRGGVPDLGWAYPTEESYLVHAIAEEMAEMALFSAAAPPAVTVTVKAADPAAGVSPHSYDVAVQAPRFAAQRRITLTPHVWAASAYAPLATDLAKRAAGAGRGKIGAGGSALEALVTPTAAVFIAESGRVSRRLTASPADAEAHEQAAFILGAFALREAAREHSDTRMLLSRMTSHLALAAALRRGALASRDGPFASIIVSVLTGRQVEALEALAGLAGTTLSPAESAWIRALSIRTHGDWRQLADPAHSTLVSSSPASGHDCGGGASRAWTSWSWPREPIPDWSRIGLPGDFSVDEGHFMPRGRPSRARGARTGLGPITGHPPVPSNWSPQWPGCTRCRTPAIRVLDWATWAAATTRHIEAQIGRPTGS